jgi:hypothetical protein
MLAAVLQQTVWTEKVYEKAEKYAGQLIAETEAGNLQCRISKKQPRQ